MILRLLYPITFKKSGIIRASHQIVYGVISQTQDYGNFIPWCKSARIIEKSSPINNKTQLCITFKNFKDLYYTSDVTLAPTQNPDNFSTIHSICTEEPLKQLDSLWQIKTHNNVHSYVRYTLKFEFQSPIYQLASSIMIDYLGQQMWRIFQNESLKRQRNQNYSDSIVDGVTMKTTISDVNSGNLDEFLCKNDQIKVLYERDKRFKDFLDRLDERVRGSQDYDKKIKFQIKNWQAHH